MGLSVLSFSKIFGFAVEGFIGYTLGAPPFPVGLAGGVPVGPTAGDSVTGENLLGIAVELGDLLGLLVVEELLTSCLV